MTLISKKRLLAGVMLAIVLLPSPAMAWFSLGLPEKTPDVQKDTEFLSGFRSSSQFLRQAGLTTSGVQLVQRIEDRFPIVLHESAQIKGCSRNGKGVEITSCDKPFDEWQSLNFSLIRTPVPGVWVYAPYLDAVSKYESPIMIGFDKNRLLTVDTLNQVILVLDQSFLEQSMKFDTEEARRHFRIGAYIGAARVFDALVFKKKPLKKCTLGLGACDLYRDGAITQASAYYLDASISCERCSSIDKAALINVATKLLTGAPSDADVDVLEVIRIFRNVINQKTIPEALVKDLEDAKLLKIGLSPRID